MKLKDFIAVGFPQEESKTYYAIVTKVLPDNKFECKFVHSGSVYKFKINSGWLEVVETSGAFKVGTRTNNVLIFTETDQSQLSANTNARVTFDDGNAYLGVVKVKTPSLTEISFLHSGNTYSFDENNVALKPGSPYDGRKALEIKVYGQGKNLFSGTHECSLSLSINDNFNKQLSGEFDITIKRTDTDQIVYQNILSAEDSTANDNLSLSLAEGQNLIILVHFHPAFEPYQSNPISSSDIDRETTIPGSKTFTFKNIPHFHFDVVILNDVSTVTSMSEKEAIETKFEEVSTNSSHSFETKFEGEAGIKLFGIGGTVTGGGGTNDTTGSGTSKSFEEADGTTTGESRTYQVYSPKGLQITPTFT